MNTPSQTYRIEIWRYTYARSSLSEARMAAKYLLDHPTLDAQLRIAVVYRTVIAYARPFTKSRVRVKDAKAKCQAHPKEPEWIWPLDESIVPERFQAVHKEHLQMRNQAIGHRDATAFQSHSLNKVAVRVSGTCIELCTFSVSDIGKGSLVPTIELCDFLVEHCAKQLPKYVEPCLRNVPDGIYLMSTEESPTVWLDSRH